MSCVQHSEHHAAESAPKELQCQGALLQPRIKVSSSCSSVKRRLSQPNAPVGRVGVASADRGQASGVNVTLVCDGLVRFVRPSFVVCDSSWLGVGVVKSLHCGAAQ